MNSIRVHLEKIGYSKEEIEGDFIPIMVLRNHFDVAHAGLAIPDYEQLQIMYKYLMNSEYIFKDLLKRILDKVADGSYLIAPTDDLRPDAKQQEKMDRLIASMSSCLSSSPESDDIPQLGSTNSASG
jgi:hypothetical protein